MRTYRFRTLVTALALGAAALRAQDAPPADTTAAPDTQAPSVTDVVCPAGRTVATGTFPVAVTFSEPMDVDAGCYVTFGTEKPYNANAVNGAWEGDRTWKGTATVAAKTVNGTQTLKITGARDRAQNPMRTVTGHTFVVDTRAPGIKEFTTEPAGHAGPGKLSVTVVLDEEADTRTVPEVSCGITKPFRDIRFKGAWQGTTEWRGSADVQTGVINGAHTFRIAGVKDALGNEAAANTAYRIRIDTQKPVPVVALSAGRAVVGPGTLEVTLLFDEDMDSGAGPAVTFGPAAPFDAMTVRGAWKNARQWGGAVSVNGNTPNGVMTLRVGGARDAAGNVMEPDVDRRFDVDTRVPGITAVAADPPLTGPGTVTVAVTVDEAVVTDRQPAVRCVPAGGGDALTVQGTWKSATEWRGTLAVAADAANGAYGLAVAGIVDAAGNEAEPYEGAGFTVDTRAPGVAGAVLSRTGAVGPGDLGVTVTFNEEVDRERAPAVTCGPLAFTGTFASATVWKGSASVGTGTANGSAVLKVAGYRDPAGNAGGVHTGAGITIDTETPVVTSAALDRAGALNAGPLAVTVAFSEPLDSGSAPQVSARRDNDATAYPFTGAFSDGAAWKGVLEIAPDMPQGSYTTTVTGGRDAAGNPCGAHTLAPFTVDTRAPVITETAFLPGAVTGAGDLTVTVRFSEEMDVKRTPVLTVEPAAGTFAGEWVRLDTWEATMAVTDGMACGRRTLTVKDARDAAGNTMASAAAGTFTIDTAPPSVTGVSYGRSAPVGQGELTFAVTFSEPVDADVLPAVSLQPAGAGAPLTCTGAWADSVTWRGGCVLSAATAAGEYAPAVSGASDRVGNRMDVERGKPVLLDPVPPEIADVTLSGDGAVAAGTLSVAVAYDEVMDTAVSPAVGFDGGTFAGRWRDARTWAGTAVITAKTPQGLKVVAVSGGRDRAGNAPAAGEHGSFIVDTSPPAASGASVVAADGAEYTTGRNVPFTWNGFEDGGAGIVKYYFAVSDGGGTRKGAVAAGDTAAVTAAADGALDVFVWAEDAAGNIGAAASDRITVDTEPPAVTGVAADRTLTGAGRVRITVRYGEPMDRDSSPLVTYGVPGSGAGTATGRWTSDTSYTADATVSATTPNGTYRVTVTGGSDRAGNSAGRDSSCSFVVDTEPPLLTGAAFGRPSPLQPGPLDMTLTFNEDADTAVRPAVRFGTAGKDGAAVTGAWTNAREWRGTAGLAGKKDGTYALNVSAAADRAGNVMEPDAAHAVVLDGTPPAVTSFRIPLDGPVGEGALPCTLAFGEDMDTARAPDVMAVSPGKRFAFTGAWSTARGWAGRLATGKGMDDGAYRVTVSGAADRAGNVMADLAGTTFVKDTRPPDTDNATVSVKGGKTALNVRTFGIVMDGFSDAGTGVAAYHYSLTDNGGTGKGTVTASPGGTLTASDDGVVKFYAWAADAAGNISPAVAGSVRIDATPPVLTEAAFGRPGPALKGAVPVALSFNEDMAQDKGITAVFGADGTVRPAAQPWSDARTWNGYLGIDGNTPLTKTFLAVSGARDRAGNEMPENRNTAFSVPVTAVYLHAEALRADGDAAAAERQYERCVEAWPGYAAALRRLGELREDAGDAEGAYGRYTAAAAADPLDAELQYLAGRTAVRLGRDGEAERAFARGRLLARGPSAVRVSDGIPYEWHTAPLAAGTDGAFNAYGLHRLDGIVKVRAGDWDGAAEAFAVCLELDNESAETRYNLGTALLFAGKRERGVRELEQATGMDGALTGAELHLGVAAAMAGSLRSARGHFEAAAGGRTAAAARANLALLDAVEKGTAAAIGGYAAVHRRDGTPRTARNMALLLQAAGRNAEALKALETLRDDSEGTGRTAFLRGALLQDADRGSDALPHLLASLAGDPFRAEACYRSGRVMQKDGFLEEAELWYSRAVALREDYREAYANLGLVYGRLGMREKEMAAYARAHALRRAAGGSGRAVAVTAFGNTAGDEEYAWLGVGIAEALTSDLRAMSGLHLVERLKVEQAMREMALASTDLIAGETGEMGRLTGAEAVLTGGYQVVGENVKIDARMIDAASGEILAAAAATGGLDDIFGVQRDLALNLLREMGEGADAGEKGAVRKRQKGSLEALRYLSEGITSYYKGEPGAMDDIRKAVELDDGFADVLGSIDPLSPEEKRQRTIAVMEFGNTTGGAAHDWMKKGIAEALTTDLKNVTGLYLVERVALKKALDEIHLGMADIVDAKTAPKIGGMVGAGVILTGGFQVQDATVRIDCRMVDAGNGDVLMGEAVQGGLDAIFDLEEELALKIADALDVGVSAAERRAMAAAADPAYEALRGIALEQSGLSEEAPDEEVDRAMAVVSFKNNCGTAARRYAWLQESIGDVLTTEFRKSGRVRLVDRGIVAAQVGEENLRNLVGMDDVTPEARKLIPADFLLQGGYQVAGDNLRIDGRLVEVETGTILFTESASGPKSDVLSVELDLAGRILSSVGRSARGKKGDLGLELAADDRLKAPTWWMAGGAGVTAAAFVTSQALYSGARAEYDDTGEGYHTANGYYQARNFFLGTMLTTAAAAGTGYLWNRYWRAVFLRKKTGPAAGPDVAGGE